MFTWSNLNLNLLHDIKDGMFMRLGYARIGRLLERYGVLPHHITIVGAISAAIGIWALFYHPWVFIATMVVTAYADALDGWYARFLHRETEAGKWLDHGIDFFVGLALLIKSYLYLREWWVVAICVLFSLEMVGIILFHAEKEMAPPKIFITFYFFGAYRLGLIAEVIYSVIVMVGYALSRRGYLGPAPGEEVT